MPVGNTLKIPVVGFSVNSVLGQTQFASYLPLEDMQMTGLPSPRDPPSLNNDGVTPTPPTGTTAKEGFNCGLGYAKGITWIATAGIGDGQSALTSGDEGGAAAQALARHLALREREVFLRV